MSATKFANKFRRASTLVLGDGEAPEKDQKSHVQTSAGISPAIQKRPSLLKSRVSFQEKVTGSLKLGKNKYSPTPSMLALPK
jgi:hypothetical protein